MAPASTRWSRPDWPIALPEGDEAQASATRSGLAAKHGVTVLNAPGTTLDAGLSGRDRRCADQSRLRAFTIRRGGAFAQMVIRSGRAGGISSASLAT